MRSVYAAFGVASFLMSAAVAGAATTSCSTVAACVFGANSSIGYGVEGTSKGNDGVVGMTTENATSASTGKAGVAGYDGSTNNGSYNSGVYGTSKNGYGVQGKATGNGTGLYGLGTSNGGEGVRGSAPLNGIVGIATSTTDAGFGVTGSSLSKYGFGVFGDSNGGTGVEGYSGGSGTALLGQVETNGDALQLNIVSLSGAPTGYFLKAEVDESDNMSYVAATIDSTGDAYFAGGIGYGGSPSVRTTSSAGKDLTSYGARASSPTLEDFGQGSLRQGLAHIALEQAYSSTIDRRSYMVFITPQGDSRGLYTTAITTTGFDVRENGGGRSSLAFSYRIVGRPIDTKAQRLPLMVRPVVVLRRRLNPGESVTTRHSVT